MTNWPNIQEYRNFEAKFFDNSKYNFLNKSPGEIEEETVERNQFQNFISENYVNESKQSIPESKTVRCVIRKDFEESFKKFDRGDGATLGNESIPPKSREATTVNQTVVDKIRLENHLKWKKQKEEEYYQKKEAEKAARLKKKEEELRMEKIKKQREKVREEKIREWQEQKTREKEEKKKEKMVIKLLEEELKEVTPSVDKERLIEEWVRLKNRQKQMEAEKKAELQKKVEESRALRQNLAELSYRQWKERIKGRMMTLPKNGYQIFGPKPVPVVKEDWNHNFTSNSPRQEDIELKSTTASFTSRPAMKELEDLSKDILYLENLRRNSSFYRLKTVKSGINLCNAKQTPDKAYEMPLKELQQGVVDLKKNWVKNVQSGYELGENMGALLKKRPKINSLSKINEKNMASGYYNNQSSDFMFLNSPESDQNSFVQVKKPSKLLDEFPEILPNKKKINLYINTCSQRNLEGNPVKPQKKKTTETDQKETGKNVEKKKKSTEAKKKTSSVEKSVGNLQKSTKSVSTVERKTSVRLESQTCRRSRSYDKSVKKTTWDKAKQCSSSASMMKVTGERGKPLRVARSKTDSCQKRKSRSQTRTCPLETNAKRRFETEAKAKKKLKKRNSFLSKSLSFSDSPYCVKKTISKDLNKAKVSKENGKIAEAKSDRIGRSRKLSNKT